jgi:hypothetical protein
MPGIRFTDTQGHENVVALGLPAGRLALAGAGVAGAFAASNLPLPEAVRALLGICLILVTAALTWLRLEGLPLSTWARRGVGFCLRRRLPRGRGATDWIRTDAEAVWGKADP